MFNMLHGTSGSDFAKYRRPVIILILVTKVGITYLQRLLQFMGSACRCRYGIKWLYNTIRQELNATLSKKGQAALPNDDKSYKEEVDRVRASFQNINQITQFGIYGPTQ